MLVDEAMSIFIGLTSADKYATVLSHLGPDKMVSSDLPALEVQAGTNGSDLTGRLALPRHLRP